MRKLTYVFKNDKTNEVRHITSFQECLKIKANPENFGYGGFKYVGVELIEEDVDSMRK